MVSHAGNEEYGRLTIYLEITDCYNYSETPFNDEIDLGRIDG